MNNKKTFYVTTPIYYPSGELHIGHAYTTTLADILNRYKKNDGYETFFLTGSDEHGEKIEIKSAEMGLPPLQFLEEKVNKFKELWKALGIHYSKFIRTTDKYHEDAVKRIFTKLLEQGDIYKGFYEGKYCISCEEFLTTEQIDENGFCKISHTLPTDVKEETYFLKTSAYQEFITDLLNSNFIIPDYRKNEMLKNFVEPGLKDLSVTRISFKWGIPITEDPKHVIYVWLDALTNYITALGYMQKNHELFDKFWSEDTEIVQLVGKEITRFHSIYWPIILKMLDLRIPNKLVSHGWILSNNDKMSKSLGNVVNPMDYIEEFGADGLRFYIANELPIDKDGNFSREMFIESYNAYLANNIGNLISRVNNMITKYFDGHLGDDLSVSDEFIDSKISQLIDDYKANMDKYDIYTATRKIVEFSAICNKYIEDKEPWNLDKENKTEELRTVLMSLQKAITVISFLLKPILVFTYDDMIEQTGIKDPENLTYGALKTFDNLSFNKLGDKKVLFQRIKK
ncbi:methionine--tRNA ligase [Mesoplasma lactucae]|uniref:Methionine--tRNA ligase n=1 Tax=Mesoplasma lactucae ATCC 49193 TaxID=81460 RepID=A0A291ISP7_9MOLU|nr:methionine--tRNA ligase [Mesoplasma lactucae]ATG97721.1 methionine--tRNA ligase [Mesoplasma lactucae ATCC 49193]ATZ20504.1 methionyl-tRNA synthetase [Mesoplasma lactucae ATCC 49193]MCL8216675.1 Methionine--tRNA ligase [Mesoplasma lactucae ATCC 49193]